MAYSTDIKDYYRRAWGLEDSPKFKYGGSWADWMTNFSDQMTFEEYLRMDLKEKKPHILDRKAEGGLMNLKGMEMDLRGGGFVPLGAKEKADDVPARLSKNEFVMTADAVRAAGGGSIDKGADKMYNLMKDLEAKV